MTALVSPVMGYAHASSFTSLSHAPRLSAPHTARVVGSAGKRLGWGGQIHEVKEEARRSLDGGHEWG